MPVSRRRLAGCLVLVAGLLVIVAAAYSFWLPWVGLLLVKAGPPRKADIAVVLAGDERGRRILEAAQLVREQYVPAVLVSGPSGNYGHYECDLAIPFAMEQGYPQQYFIRAPHEARSTREEAEAIVRQLRTMGVKSYILVTSDFHTRRAGRFFKAVAPELTMHVVAAPDSGWDLRTWWQDREGQKAVFEEWIKTVTSYFGI